MVSLQGQVIAADHCASNFSGCSGRAIALRPCHTSDGLMAPDGVNNAPFFMTRIAGNQSRRMVDETWYVATLEVRRAADMHSRQDHRGLYYSALVAYTPHGGEEPGFRAVLIATPGYAPDRSAARGIEGAGDGPTEHPADPEQHGPLRSAFALDLALFVTTAPLHRYPRLSVPDCGLHSLRCLQQVSWSSLFRPPVPQACMIPLLLPHRQIPTDTD